MTFYYTEESCQEARKDNEMMFAVDHIKTKNGKQKTVKKYFNATYKQIGKVLQSDKNVYETYDAEQPIKFFVDIDYKVAEESAFNIKFCDANSLLSEARSQIETFLRSKGFQAKKPIILNATTDKKFSYHLVYSDLVFDNVKSIKNLMKMFELHTDDLFVKIIDTCVYRKGYFRCINQSKIEKNNTLRGDYNVLDTLLLTVDKNATVNTFLNPIDEIKKEAKKELKNERKSDKVLNDGDAIICEQDIIQLTVEMATDFLNILHSDRFSKYEDWRNVLFALKCEGDNKFFECFDNFSKKWLGYKKDDVVENWNNYKPNTKGRIFTYNSLLFWARKDNEAEYCKICKKYNLFEDMDDFKVDEVDSGKVLKINQEYLLGDKKLGNCDVSKYINDFLSGDIKTLNVLSPYNTGKTTLLTELCNRFERVLFISYRVTLTNNLIGAFQKLGFITYFDERFDFNKNKVICQVDSLPTKLNLGDTYDLVIIDEIEGVLNHFSSPTLKNPKLVFDFMVNLCADAKKIINLDGDLGARSMTFTEIFGDYRMIVNSVQKDKKRFILHCDEEVYNNLIREDLGKGKNICVISMSSKNATYYYNLYKEQYKSILYTSTTGDKDKKLLADVENIWPQYQLVIYSPCIEAGVDFNIEHFDRIYIVLSKNSTSQRGLKQMIHRVRQVKNNKVHTYLNDIPANETSIKRHYTIKEVETYYSHLMDESDVLVKEDGKLKEKTGFSSYDRIRMYNKLETLNKHGNCFLPLFLRMIQNSGHTYEFQSNDKKVKRTKKENINLERIVNAERISKTTYANLLIEQARHNLTEQEKYQIQKYIYEDKFKIQINDIQTMKKVNGKLNTIHNFKTLLMDTYTDTDKTREQEVNVKCGIIRNILKTFNIDAKELPTCDYVIQNETLNDNIKSIDTMVTENKILLGLNKAVKIETTTKLLGTLNTLLDNYGIVVKSKSKAARQDGQVTRNKSYTFSLMDEVKNSL